MLLVPGVVVLLDEAKVLLPFPLQGQLPALRVGGEIALRWETQLRADPLSSPALEILPAVHPRASGTQLRSWGKSFHGIWPSQHLILE